MTAMETRKEWAYQEMARQYTQMGLGVALDTAVGEGRHQAGFCRVAG